MGHNYLGEPYTSFCYLYLGYRRSRASFLLQVRLRYLTLLKGRARLVLFLYLHPFIHSPTTARPIFNILPVFPQQGIRVLSPYPFGFGDIILLFLQPVDDLFRGLIVCFHVFSVQIGHDIVQSIKTNLGVIRECQYAPATCRWCRNSTVFSPLFFMQLHRLLSY